MPRQRVTEGMRIVLRLLTGVALVGLAVVHLRIASTYESVGKHPLSIGDQFYAQAVIAFVLTAALLVRPHRLVWACSLLFAVGSLAVLIYSRYHALPVYGFAGGFQEGWGVRGAKPAAVFEGLAIVLSLLGLVTARSAGGSAVPAARAALHR
ncbi:MAG: hypothetical protein QOD70_2847 [Frankiales bacterium]|nr:hypothetical protein [Frankiales bacterium]